MWIASARHNFKKPVKFQINHLAVKRLNPDLDGITVTNTSAALYQVNVFSANRRDPSFSNLDLTVLKRSAIIIFCL